MEEGVAQASSVGEEQQAQFIDLDDDTYDEDGDEEYECPARNVVDQSVVDQSADTSQQFSNYLQEITHFTLTKSDIDKVLSQLQNVEGLGEDFAEVVNAKLEEIMKEYKNVNGEFRVRVEQSGNGAIFESSASPTVLQMAFDTIWKQYLETEEGQVLQGKRADSAFKHKMDSYNNFQVNAELLDALGDVPKETINRVVQDYIKLENIRLQYDAVNPIHNVQDDQHIAQSGALDSNQESSRTKLSSGGNIGEEVDMDNSNVAASSQLGTTSDSPQSGSHISQQQETVVDPQSQQRELQQRMQQLQQQMEDNQENVDRTPDDSKQPSKVEL